MRIPLFSSLKYTNKSKIDIYFQEQPWLKDVVTQAHKKLKDYFPSDTFELCYKIDTANFEEEEGYLVLYVVTKMKIRAAKNILSKFDDEWWSHQNGDCYNHLAINISYEGLK